MRYNRGVGSSRYTEADRALCARLLDEFDIDAEPRRIQEWRRLGFIDHEVRSLGRGRGRIASYPPQAIEQARTVYGLVSQYAKLSYVTLALFGVGYNPTEKALRRAFKSEIERYVKRSNGMLLARNEEAGRYGDWVRRGSASMARDIPEVGEKLRALALAEAQEQVYDYATGEMGSLRTEARRARENAIGDLVAALVDPDQSDGSESILYEAMGLDVDAIDEIGGAATFAEMQQAIDDSTYKELIDARDIVRRGFLEDEEDLPFEPGSPVAVFIGTNLDNPSSVGIAVALCVPGALATGRRFERASAGEQSNRSA